jgi:hypothetical protein
MPLNERNSFYFPYEKYGKVSDSLPENKKKYYVLGNFIES